MSDPSYFTGKTTIAPDVLVTIVTLTVAGISGVSRLAPVPGRINRVFKREAVDGVEIFVENNTVYADVYVIFQRDINVRDVSRTIQNQVARAVKEMVGMEVARIDVHVTDIDLEAKVQ